MWGGIDVECERESDMSIENRDLRVFLAEDNQADVYLVEMALQEHGLRFTLTSALDGEEAISRMGLFQASDCPDIALLDQNLPRVTGEKVMEAIRAHEHCKSIPIVIMSSSEHRREQEIAQKFGATFFRKAANLNDFMELGALVKQLCDLSKSNCTHQTNQTLKRP
jgi:chemotaxis family two-component system response regulator Rcp1